MSMSALTCHACGQTLPRRTGRVCGLCYRPIRRHERWEFIDSVARHKDCANPTLKEDEKPSMQAMLSAEPGLMA